MSSKNDPILFEHFIKLLHNISHIQPRRQNVQYNVTETPKSLELVNQWFSKLREYSKPADMCKIFFRLFFPEEDVRRRYNIKEATLATILAREVYAIPTDSQGAGRALIEWSDYPETSDKAKLGCLGAELEIALHTRYSVRQGTSPTLEKVDQLLDELASLSDYSNLGNYFQKSCRNRATILKDLYRHLNPVEAKFMTQIILKDLRPVLYPLTETHTTKALLHYKSNAIHMLTKWEVMRAWHPSMCSIYRARAVLDEAVQQVAILSSNNPKNLQDDPFSPTLGIPLEVPKSQKSNKLLHALRFFKEEREVWAETKYDGERMQIHIDLSKPCNEQITIFSKSRRDSTQDRRGTHALIRAALGLPAGSADTLQYPTLASRAAGKRTLVKKSVILDAEMVAYSESMGEIDEFWRIRSLVNSTACGVRRSRYQRYQPAEEVDSQNTDAAAGEPAPEIAGESLQSTASDNSDRHLKIVFFDVMFLDGCSLMRCTYRQRRSQLERLINIIPGFVSLSHRERTDLDHGLLLASNDLARIFSQHIATRQEGIVLKGGSSIYNNFRQPWVKLKRDYIPGYGDTVDLVIIGAGWNKARARELRVAPETFTTFLVAALDLSSSGSNNYTTSRLPVFQALFVVEYGLDRKQLENLNLYIKTSDPVQFRDLGMSRLPYDFRIPEGLGKLAVMFSKPLLGELFGAGFTKEAGMKYYTLRFPRLTKVWRSTERHWTTGCCLADFQNIARESVGRESTDAWASRTVDAIWGSDLRPGPKDPRKIAETARVWYDKFMKDEQIPHEGTSNNVDNAVGIDRISNSSMRRKTSATATTDGRHRKRQSHEISDNEPPQDLRTLGSVTNLAEGKRQNTTPRNITVPSHLSQRACRNNSKKTKTNQAKAEMEAMIPVSPGHIGQPRIDVILGRTCHLGFEDAESEATFTAFQLPTPSASDVIFSDDAIALSQANNILSSALNTTSHTCSVEHPSNMNVKTIPTKTNWPQQYINVPIVQFLQDSYVWICKEDGNKRPIDRPPASHIVPQNRRVGVVYFLLIICGCRVEIGGKVYCRNPEQFSHVNKCVMFVKTSEQPEVKEALVWTLEALESWKEELNLLGNKELFVFDSQILSYKSLTAFSGDIESQALWRSSQ